jgi:hypothetical protein
LSFQSFRSAADVVENNACKMAVKKRRGRPKGVLNRTIMEIQSMPRSPIKLRGKNSAGSSFLSQNFEAILEKETSEVIEGQLV